MRNNSKFDEKIDDKSDDELRPITLHVTKIDLEIPTLRHIHRRRVQVVDIEMGVVEAEQLNQFVSQRLRESTPGSIRVRLYGRLVLE